jgi:hypothetical protein
MSTLLTRTPNQKRYALEVSEKSGKILTKLLNLRKELLKR